MDRGRHRGLRRAQLDGAGEAGLRQRAGAQPVDPVECHAGLGQRRPRPDDDAAALGLEPDDIERIAAADAQTPALADGVAANTVMAPEHGAAEIDDIAGKRGVRPKLVDDGGIIAVGDEADVLAVGLLGDGEAEAFGEFPGRRLARHGAKREAQQIELRPGGGEEEIALVPGRIGGAVELGPRRADLAPHVMPGRQRVGAEVARGGQEIAELDGLVAADARDRGLAAEIGIGEIVDDLGAEAGLVIEHVMGDGEPLRHLPRIVDVLAGAARPGPGPRGAVIVKLQGDADDLIALLDQQRGGNG